MSYQRTRREVLRDVGRGMFLATLGPAVSLDLGLAPAHADDGLDRLTFGDLDPLVNFIHETPPDKILAKAIEKLNAGLDLKTLVAATALANARAFGGEDYVGFHTLMALAPAYHMSAEEKDPARKPLAVLKVLYRNATRLSEMGQTKAEALKPVPAVQDAKVARHSLKELVRQNEVERIVVGLPLHTSGREGRLAELVRAFGDWLAAVTGQQVIYFDERYTTVEAEQRLQGAGLKRRKRKPLRDQLAAQILLQAYLDAGCPKSPTVESLDG